MLASINNLRNAHFDHKFLYHEGIFVKKDIQEAIRYYKEASSFKNQYSKNNLGIIYKHCDKGIEAKTGNEMVYFEKAIRQKIDYLSMYNLAHIYMYDKTINQDLNKSIDLLIRSMDKFNSSIILLSLALLLRFDFNIEKIKQEVKESSIKKLFKIIDKSLSSFYMNHISTKITYIPITPTNLVSLRIQYYSIFRNIIIFCDKYIQKRIVIEFFF